MALSSAGALRSSDHRARRLHGATLAVVALAFLTSSNGCKGRAAATDASLAIVPFDHARVCDGNGALGSNAGSICPSNVVIPYDELLVIGKEVAGLPSCGGLDPAEPGFQLSGTVDSMPEITPAGTDGVNATVRVRASSPAGPCGFLLAFTSYGVVPTLNQGDSIQVSKRLVQGQMERDSGSTTVLADVAGHVLFADVRSVASTARIAFDYLPGLSLDVSSLVICSTPAEVTAEERKMHRVTFSTGAKSCALDHHTMRCCDLWDTTYEVRVQDAFSSKYPSPYVNFELARRGFWTPVGTQ